ncbi:hypothetical protein FACS1894181_16310 [Bacteroidia bacterium]|nr:hypothetical protein FACS1894181_16310 [Bacteroidia bacterium]
MQDKPLATVQEELVLARRSKPAKENCCIKDGKRISSQYRFQTNIPCHEKHRLHWFQCLESRKKDVKPGEQAIGKPEESRFEYVTNIEPAAGNIMELSNSGRLRWKIENGGFNAQKCGDYELEHKYSRTSYDGLQNYYTCLQIAHAVNQLVEHSKDILEMLKEHSGETIRNIRENLISYMIMVAPGKDILISPHPS